MILKKIVGRLGKAFVFGALLGTGCFETYETKLEDALKKKGFTDEQAKVGVVMGERMLFMREVKEQRDEDGTVSYKYELAHIGVNINDSLEKIDEIVADLEGILSHKNSVREEKFIDKFNLRGQLEKQQKIFAYLHDSLTQRQLFNKFNDLMGTRQPMPISDPHFVRPDEAYSLGSLLPPASAADELLFDAKYVQDSRKNGKLNESSLIVEKVEYSVNFQDKIPNPDYPHKDPNSMFIFKERTRKILILSYNLDGNSGKTANYIEAYKLNDAGVRESKPAIKLFRPLNSSDLQVLVADKDPEADKKGFGKPDLVDQVFGISVGSDLIKIRNDLLEYVFKQVDKPPVPKIDESVNDIYFVETGKHNFAQYEIDKNGWENFLPDYKRSSVQDSFDIYVKFESSLNDEAEIIKLKKDRKPVPRKIEWIAKVEFYKPSDIIKDGLFTAVRKQRNNELEFWQKGKPTTAYSIDDVMQEKPFRIDFDYSAEKRWSIVDQDNDWAHYEAKQELRRPDNLRLPPLAQ